MSCIQTNILAGASGQGTTGYEIERSLRFNSADSASLSRTPSSAGNRKTWTWSGWVKIVDDTEANIFNGGTSGSNDFSIRIDNGQLCVQSYTGSWVWQVKTTALFRDPSAWYHFLVSFDSTHSTSADRIKIYVNGVQHTNFSTSTYPSQNLDSLVNSTVPHTFAYSPAYFYSSFYLADVHFIDGQALAPTDFGETDANGVWQPKMFAGTYTLPASGTVYSNNCNAVSNPANAFDGNLNTYAETSGPTSQIVWSNIGGLSGTVRVYVGTSGGTRYLISTNDGTTVTTATFWGGGWVTVGSASNITTITTTRIESGNTNPTNDCRVYGYEINGTIYTDGTTAQGANSFHLPFTDNSSNAALGTDTSGVSPANTWTVNNLTQLYPAVSAAGTTSGSPYSASFPWSTAFDGSITSVGAVSNAGGANSYVHTFTTPIPCTTAAFVIYTSYTSALEAGNGCAMNGVALTATASANWTKTTNTLPVGSGSVGDYFVYTVNLGGTPLSSVGVGNTMRISAVLIDGVPIPSSGSGSDTDSLRDTPTNGTQVDTGVGGEVVGNYATLNPLKVSGQTLKNGNLVCSGTSGNVTGTIYVSTGKYYWEFTAGSSYTMSGIESSLNSNMSFPGASSEQYALYGNAGSGSIYHNSSTSSFDGFVSGDVIGVALDMDVGKLYFYKNGSAMNSGNPAATGLLGKAWTCNCRSGSGAYDGDTIFNFGQRAFAYTAPSGYKALCTANLPDPTIADGSTAFNGVTYTGDGNSPRDITGYSFSPDLVWYKQRDSARDHQLYDIVRGAGTDKSLATNTTYAENANDDELYGYLSAFNSDGFEVTTGSTNYNYNNNSGSTYVAWAWDAGSSTTTIAAGGLNSSLYDQSQTWSNGTQSGNAPYGSSSWDYVFNGVIPSTFDQSNLVYQIASGGVFTFSSAISGRIQVYSALGSSGYLSGNTIVLSDGSSQEVTNGNSNFVLYDFGTKSNITSITLNGAGSSSGLGVPGILLDGKLLVDAGVSITTPSIASTVRANPSAGFSIVSYTGTANTTETIGHGLNAAPELIIIKQRNSTSVWPVYHGSLGTNIGGIILNGTSAASSGTAGVFPTAPTSSVYTIGNDVNQNGSGNTYVAYCFAPVEGYSAFGSYTGNGSADGTFVYTGHRSRFLLIKATSIAGEDWVVLDTARETFNAQDDVLFPNLASAEVSNSVYNTDILSNGFKLRGTNPRFNQSGATYIYASFAENPFKTARAR